MAGAAQQASNPKLVAKPQARVQDAPVKLTQQQKFVMDTVRMAVALPEPMRFAIICINCALSRSQPTISSRKSV